MMSPALAEKGFARHDSLVDTAWVAEHLNDPQVRFVESNEDPLLFAAGHIPGAVEVDWTRDLNDQTVRDYLDGQAFAQLCSRLGITPETKVVFYGDRNNWWATYAFWVFQLFGHTNAAIIDGGRIKWQKEGREMTRESVRYPETSYPVPTRDDQTFRAFREDVLTHIRAKGHLVDVRSPQEFTGERLHMDGFPNEGAVRGGHIPGAKNVPWARAVNPEDGTFLPAADLRAIYEQEIGLKPEDNVVAYCRIGERSSHTWFVLHYLLGYNQVRNYDGSWTEWGNSVGLPIEK